MGKAGEVKLWKRVLLPAVTPLLPYAIVLAQRYMRSRFPIGKRLAWSMFIEPRLAGRHHRFVCETLFGARLAGDTADIQQRYVYYLGLWEPNLTNWIRENLRSGDAFIDIGANVGYFTLLASRLVGPTGRVVAIEASPTIYAELVRNVSLNSAKNVRTVNVAASNSDGVLPVYRGPVQDSGLTTTIPYLDFVQYEGSVQARALADICSAEEIASARIIKIDVEGAEWAVADGMRNILNKTRSDVEIAIEVSAERLAAAGKHPDDVFEIFEAAGFRPYQLRNDYSSMSYIHPLVYARPERMSTHVVSELNDYVFSRRDVNLL